MLEMGTASVSALVDVESAAIALTAVSISAPLILPALGRPSYIEVACSHQTGTVEVRSVGRQHLVHSQGSAAQVVHTYAGMDLCSVQVTAIYFLFAALFLAVKLFHF